MFDVNLKYFNVEIAQIKLYTFHRSIFMVFLFNYSCRRKPESHTASLKAHIVSRRFERLCILMYYGKLERCIKT